MTISSRNRLLLAGIGASVPLLAALLLNFREALGSGSKLLAAAALRSVDLAGLPGTSFLHSSASAVVVAVPLAVLFAAVAVTAFYYLFEKTQAPEIVFFAFFALSLSAEACRFILPLAWSRAWPPALVVLAARVITFARFFGALSLFSASVYANGLEYQKHGRVLIMVAIAALTVATGLPVDGQAFDSSLTPITGYRDMIGIAEFSIALLAVAGFFAAGYSRSSKEYTRAGFGMALVFVGRALFLGGDSWIVMPLGLALLCAGTWMTTSQIHRYYLWL